MKSELLGNMNEGKPDPIRAIQKIFEEHNKECLETKKGRMIKIPRINLNQDFYWSYLFISSQAYQHAGKPPGSPGYF